MERISNWRWLPPWMRHEHVGRYQWASQFARQRVVLDAACGIGYGAHLVARHDAQKVFGCDLSPAAIEKAREGTLQDDKVRFEVADVTGLPLPDHVVDLYLSFETIEHVDNDRQLLAESLRVLKPNGLFICSTPNRELVNPGNALEDPPGNRHHVREYSYSEFNSLLRTYFSVVEWYGQTFLPGRYCRLLEALGRVHRKTARRFHQIQKVCGMLFRNATSHYPQRMDGRAIPEVLIAVCTAQSVS